MRRAGPDPRHGGTLHRLRLLATDTAVYGLASAVSRSFSLILFPLLTRSMSVADYGRLDLALYAAMLFGLIMIWGQDSAVARLFFESEDHEDRRQTVSQALLLVSANSVLIILVMLAVVRTPDVEGYFGPQTWRIAALLLFFAPISGLLSFAQSLLKWTFQRNRYIAIALGMPAANLVLLLGFSRADNFGPVTALAVMTVVGALFAVAALTMVREWLTIPRDASFLRKLVPLALPYGLISAIAALSPFIERAVVGERFGAAELGLYAAAAKLASIATMLAIAFQMGWGPFAYALYKEADAARTYNLVLRAFSALMCVAVLSLSAAADPLARFLAGERYQNAALYVFPLAMAFGVQAIGWITEIGIHLSKRSYLSLLCLAAFFAISVTGILVLSQWIGMIGVPLAALGGHLAMMIISAIVAQRAFPIGWEFAVPAASIGVTLASGLLALGAGLRETGPDPLAFFLTGIAVVVAINLLFGFNPGERRKLRGVFRAIADQFRAPRG